MPAGGPAVVGPGDQSMHDRLDDRTRRELDQAELRPDDPQQRRQRALALPRQRGRQERQPSGAVRMAHPDLERHAPPEAVADEVRALDVERVEQVDDDRGEVPGVIGRPQRLVGIAESR